MARVPGIGPRTVEALKLHLAFASGLSFGERRPDVRRFGDPASPVNVNRAQIKELEQITGIGPALASRIVATRQRLGSFERPEDLLRVPGIGPVVLQQIREQVRF
jgi:competence protein ComEA